MKPGLLPDHLSPLVDRLRSGNHDPVSLPDVAALTEVLMRSLESYFSSIDLTVYRECQSLADYINEARAEIASLSTNSEKNDVEIPRAGQELEAIVNETEAATNTIMNAAEDIMGADSSDSDAYQTTVNDAVMKIFEACSFQDITGQRISKVVKTLQQVESRIDSLINIMDVEADKDTSHSESVTDEIDESSLLNGPALDGEGIDQSEIDSLLGGNAPIETETVVKIEAVAEETPQDNIDAMFDAPIPEDTPAKAAEVPAQTPPEETPKATEETPKATEETAQDDIDAMFDTAIPEDAPTEPIAPPTQTSAVEETAQDDIDTMFEAPPAPAPPKLVKKKPIKKEPVGDIQTPKDISEKTTSQSDIDALFN
jgi:chemotaxis regulatin CheY-phosphate phosphatase CheZ